MNVIHLKLKSSRLMGYDSVCVLLPSPPQGTAPGDYYVSGKKYPVLWLLHGATGEAETFLVSEHIEAIMRGHETMVVMPSGLNSDYADHMEFAGGYAFAGFFFDELMPYIYGTFPASSCPEDNYIAGYSMGGSGAFMLGMHKPELFGHIAAMGSSVRESGFLLPYSRLSGEQFRALAMSDPTRFPTEYGDPAKGITLKEINMIARYPDVQSYIDSMECTWERYRERAASGKMPRLLFCCGTEDGCFDKVRAFKAYAESIGAPDIQCEYMPGLDHSHSARVLQRTVELLGI